MVIDPTLPFFAAVLIPMLILPFWFVRIVKGILFYVYLWQLKEYRPERFLDHLRTEKGRQLIFNKLLLVKFILLILGIPIAVLLLYMLETSKFIYDFGRNRARKPVPTKKAKALILLNVAALFLILAFILKGIGEGVLFGQHTARLVLAVDILFPFIVSGIVLSLQPLTIFIRNRTLARARAKRSTFKNLKVVGITGSYGKTSTKEFLAYILNKKYNVLKTPEHQNSEFGVANTILNKLGAEHEVFVCEMGAYKKGEIKALAEVAQPHIGIVTGVNEQHLATFGSIENLLSAEGGEELANALPDGGTMLVNQNSRLRPDFGGQATIKYYGKAEHVKIEKNKISFEVEGVRFEVPAYGGHNGENLLGAIAAARELGMSLQEIAKAAETMPLELSPLKVKKAPNGATIIDSTYSANPDGVIADLGYLALYEGKKILVMPSLIELGPAAKEAHKKIGQKIAEVCDLAIITTKEYFEDIKEGAGDSEKLIYMEDAHEIMEKIKGADAILLEGGKESRLQRALMHKLRA